MKQAYLPLISLIWALLPVAPMVAQPVNRVYASRQIDLSKIHPIKIQIKDWYSPVQYATISVSSDHSDSIKTFITDKEGKCTIDFPDTFKNMTIRIVRERYYFFGDTFNFKTNKLLTTLPYKANTKFNFQYSHYYFESDRVIFQYFREDHAVIEKKLKDKFRFRDVKEIGTRYPLIYGRF